jgi:hypothetical protein
MYGYLLFSYGHRIPTNDKKVQLDFDFRIQNAPIGSTWGWSVWSGSAASSGSASLVTFTLRGYSSDITTSTTSTIAHYHGSFTTTSDISDDYIIVMPENRGGTLTTTTYMYGAYSAFLVD